MLTLIKKKSRLVDTRSNFNNSCMWSLRLLLAVVACMLVLSSNAFAIVSPTKEFYVNDYAGVLDAETKSYIINTNKSLFEQTGAQVVVITVKDLEGRSIEDYATQVFRSFGIGDKTKNNGVLLLLAVEERLMRIETGYGVEGFLPDAKTGRIQDEYMIPYLKKDDWNSGIKNGFSAILEAVANEYNVTVGAESAVKIEYSKGNWSGFEWFIASVILACIVGSIIGKVTNKNDKFTEEKIVFTLLGCAVPFVVVSLIVCKDLTLPDVPYDSDFEVTQNLAKFVASSVAHIGSLIIGASMTSKKFKSGGSGRRGGGFYGGFYGGHRGGGGSFGGGGFHGGGGFSGGGGSTRGF